MLIEKKSEYVVLKLSNNDEVLCKLTEEKSDENYYHVEKPRTLVRTPEGIGLTAYVQLGDETKGVQIKKSHVVSVLNMNDDIKSDYIQAVTGITIVKA